MDNPEVQQQNTVRVQISGAFLPDHAPSGLTVAPTLALKSPRRTGKSPEWALSRTPSKESKKGGYAKLMFRPLAQTSVRIRPPTQRQREATLSWAPFPSERWHSTSLELASAAWGSDPQGPCLWLPPKTLGTQTSLGPPAGGEPHRMLEQLF